MAERQSTAEDLKSGSDLLADFYTGTQEELLAAGICKRNWFPSALTLEFCKDGRPKMGNNGRQRYKRTYRVENSSPAVELWHRQDPLGHEFWIVRIEVTEVEAARRQTEYEKAADRQAREDEDRRREQDKRRVQEQAAARPVVEQLRKRYPYPEVLMIQGETRTRDDGTRLQRLTFYARELSTLRRHSLVTDEIFSVPRESNYSSGDLRGGGHFFLSKSFDDKGEYWYVTLSTEESPRERKSFPVTEAKALLKRFMSEGARGAAAPGGR